MATSSRDAKLTLSVETLGQDNISKLEKALRDLAATGDSSAAEFGQLADEIGRLGSQNAALQSVKVLSASVDELAASQVAANTAMQSAKVALAGFAAATDDARVAESSARAEKVAARQATIDATAALSANAKGTSAAGKSTQEYLAEQSRLVGVQGAARKAEVEKAEALRQTVSALSAAEDAQKKATRSTEDAVAKYNAAADAVEAQDRALSKAAAAANELGVDTKNLAAAEDALARTFEQGRTALSGHAESVKASAAAEAELTAQANEVAAKLRDRNKAVNDAYQQDVAFAEASRQAAAALAAETVAVKASEAALRQKEEAAREQRESDRLAAIQLNTMRDLRERGVQALAAEEAAIRDAEQVTRRYADAQKEAAQAVQQQAAQQEQAVQRINDAFKTINVRPISQVQLEIAEANTAMATLAASGRLTGGALASAMQQGKQRVTELEREVRQLNGTLTTADKVAGLLKNSMGQITAGNLVADGIGYLVNKVKELGAAFVTTIAQQEQLRRGLNAVYKDSQVTATQMVFLRKTALSAGVAVGDLGPSFLKFAASTKAANISLQVTNDLFAATTRAAGTLGLSGEQVSGMLEALSQMASKGSVSMEELRQQLGDRLPGALSLVAQGLGITERQLITLVESGQLAAKDMFPALTKSLKTMEGEVGGLNVTWQNFKNVLTGVAQDAGDAGWATILTGALKTLAGAAGIVGMTLSTLWEGLRIVGVGVIALAETLKGNGTEAWGYFNEQVAVTVDRLDRQNDRLTAMLNPTSEAAKRMRDLGVAQDKAAASTTAATTAMEEQPAAVASTTEALKLQAQVTKILADTQKDLGSKMVNINVIAAERIATLSKEAIAADKMAKATEVQGNALVTLTKLRGSSAETLAAEQKATEANLVATNTAAIAHKTITEVLEQQRAALVTLAKQEATGLEGRRNELEALDKKLVLSRAETAQAEAAVAAIKQEVAARKLAVETLKDNSARLAEFRAAAVAAEAAVAAYQLTMVKGYGTQAEMNRLLQQAAFAQGLYRDAVADSTAKDKAHADVLQAKIGVQTAGLSVQQQAHTQLAAAAKATGDLVMATYHEIEAKRIQIEITKLTAQAKLLEVEATRKAVEAEREELLSKGLLTEAKKLELEARLLNAKAKEAEAKGSEAIIRALDAEINALRRGTTAQGQATTAVDKHADAMEKMHMRYKLSADYSEAQVALLEKETAAIERAADAYRKYWNIDKDGFTLDANGQRQVMSAPTESYIVDSAKGAGLTEKQIVQLLDEFYRNGSPSGMPNRGVLGASKDWFTVVNEAVNRMRIEALRQSAQGGGPTGGTETPGQTTTTTTTTTSGSGSSGGAGITNTAATGRQGGQTVNINIGGRTRSVNVGGQEDARALVSVLRELETQMGTAT